MSPRTPSAGSAQLEMEDNRMRSSAVASPQPVPALSPVPPRLPPRASPSPPRELWLALHLPQAQGLQRLAIRAQRFTPRISLEPPDGVLLEVRGSLHLFGGLEGLCRALDAECDALGISCMRAVAPTTLGALAGARSGRAFSVTDPAHLVGHLAPLPLSVLRWPQETLQRLKKMGVRSIGQVLRLPRAGFARRFGAAQLDALDCLVGRRAIARASFKPVERFRERRDFLHEIEHHACILQALEPVLRNLETFLRARQSGITTLQCRLRHRHAPATHCVLKLAALAADAKSLSECLSERLARLQLPEPVRAAELRSGALIPRVAASHTLWQPGEHGGGSVAQAPQFLERIRARFGANAVQVLQVCADHRPEEAWRITELVTAAPEAGLASWPVARRPLWLLSAPQLLQEEAGQPWHRGPLRLASEPECIEAGWWDGRDVARDYYSAIDTRGVRLWVFRERHEPRRWFLHGIFG